MVQLAIFGLSDDVPSHRRFIRRDSLSSSLDIY